MTNNQKVLIKQQGDRQKVNILQKIMYNILYITENIYFDGLANMRYNMYFVYIFCEYLPWDTVSIVLLVLHVSDID